MKSCLIVDDSRVIRKVSRLMLENEKFLCEEMENGEQALETCKKKLPDVILLDWNMPVMNGIDFLRVLRTIPEGKKPIVILCTTENDSDHIKVALDAGADEYIMKPFDADILHTKLAYLGLLDA